MTGANRRPALTRAGYVPATPEGRTNRRDMLIPKQVRRDPFVPALGHYDLPYFVDSLLSTEQRALADIIAHADIIDVDGTSFLLAEVRPSTLEALAVFDAEAEDRENDLEDEEEPTSFYLAGRAIDYVEDDDMEAEPDREPDVDREPDCDLEYDHVHAYPGDAEPIRAGGHIERRPETPITAPKAIIELAQPK